MNIAVFVIVAALLVGALAAVLIMAIVNSSKPDRDAMDYEMSLDIIAQAEDNATDSD